LSVAFTKEDSAETASETLLPDRPVSPHPNLVTEAGLKALKFQHQQAREAYATAQKIEDVNERRRQSAAAKKNQPPNHGKNQTIATPSLIRWSIQEVRRIAIRLARKRIQPAHIIAWSLWRRAHQAVAQRAHFKAKRQL
jgi:hypothetical protein